jgi:hypothetical protein
VNRRLKVDARLWEDDGAPAGFERVPRNVNGAKERRDGTRSPKARAISAARKRREKKPAR